MYKQTDDFINGEVSIDSETNIELWNRVVVIYTLRNWTKNGVAMLADVGLLECTVAAGVDRESLSFRWSHDAKTTEQSIFLLLGETSSNTVDHQVGFCQATNPYYFQLRRRWRPTVSTNTVGREDHAKFKYSSIVK